jgi:hypothetical protein
MEPADHPAIQQLSKQVVTSGTETHLATIGV